MEVLCGHITVSVLGTLFLCLFFILNFSFIFDFCFWISFSSFYVIYVIFHSFIAEYTSENVGTINIQCQVLLCREFVPNVSFYYPTALKGCRGIVFIHGVRMGGRREKDCPGCISETVRCRKLILGRDIG